MRVAAHSLVIAALAGVVGAAHCASDPVEPAQTANVSIQIVNPDVRTAIRVFLDGKVIFDGLPASSTLSNISTISAQVGPVALLAGSRHALIAEVPGASTRAQLEWTPRLDGSAWVVIRYYPGRGEPAIPPFFTFSLQANSHKLR